MDVDDAEHLARAWHRAYQKLAPQHGWQPPVASSGDWENVPAEYAAALIATAQRLLDHSVVQFGSKVTGF